MRPLSAIPLALANAHHAYCSQQTARDAVPSVVFVVQPEETNVADQKLLEVALWEAHGIRVLRRSLSELASASRGPLGELIVDGREVSVIYFRAGYDPRDYPSEREWCARRLVERSLAIKCPSVAYQLVGTKKIQQVLSRPGALERFLPAADAERVRETFAGLYSLQTAEEVAVARTLVEADPEGFVLKPQREGGGNNIYGKDVGNAFSRMEADELRGYILMERIRPTAQRALLARDGRVTPGNAVCELGVFGVFLGSAREGTPRLNAVAGHLLRTKVVGTDEGGVAAGFAVLSSPALPAADAP